MLKRFCPFTLVLLVLIAGTVACGSPGKPTVVIGSPPHGSQFHEGEEIAFQSTATDNSGVARVELSVNGTLVRTDSSPAPQSSFTLIQIWKATQGTHNITVRAYNTSNISSDPAAISIAVLPAAAPAATLPAAALPTTASTVAAMMTPTTQPVAATPVSTTCTNNAAFIADVTVPDGTVLAPGQAFNKIWRVRNTGTCAWGSNYDLAYMGGEAMTATTFIAVPNTAPGATADLLVAMAAPASAGIHSGQWRLRNAGDTSFGTQLNVTISVLGNAPPPPPAEATTPAAPLPPPAACTGSPTITSFTASATEIYVGGTTNLNWGAINNAGSVEIDNGVGPVAAPGSATVSPGATTTYTLLARCGSNTATRKVTITVKPLLAPATFFVPKITLTLFRVTGVTAAYTTLFPLSRPCPYAYHARGTITTNGAGDVAYTWVRSNTVNLAATIHFDAAGSKTVDYNFSATFLNSNGTLHLDTTSPNDKVSNNLEYWCHP